MQIDAEPSSQNVNVGLTVDRTSPMLVDRQATAARRRERVAQKTRAALEEKVSATSRRLGRPGWLRWLVALPCADCRHSLSALVTCSACRGRATDAASAVRWHQLLREVAEGDAGAEPTPWSNPACDQLNKELAEKVGLEKTARTGRSHQDTKEKEKEVADNLPPPKDHAEQAPFNCDCAAVPRPPLPLALLSRAFQRPRPSAALLCAA